jgi:hypothetical protein
VFFAIALDVVVVAWLLWRQRKVRRVWPRLTLRLAVVLGVIGLAELLTYTGRHHPTAEAIGILVLSFAVGAAALGALRGLTVKLWRTGPVVLRQGTWFTIVLWVVSLALHVAFGGWLDSLHGQSGLASASLLLWLAVTYGVQKAVVHRRAEGLLAEAGPIDARSETLGGRLWIGTFGGGGGWPGAGGPGPGPAGHGGTIEARSEVVDPHDGPSHAAPGGERRPAGEIPPGPSS